MLTDMLDTNICIYVRESYPPELRERFNLLEAIEHFVTRLEVLPFGEKAAAHYGQVHAELSRTGRLCGSHDMQIGGHARSEGLIVVANNLREFERMPGLRTENWA